MVIRQRFFISKQSQYSRPILQYGSRSVGLFRNSETCIIAKFISHRTDLTLLHSERPKLHTILSFLDTVGLTICCHSGEREILSYSQINTVLFFAIFRRGPVRYKFQGLYELDNLAIVNIRDQGPVKNSFKVLMFPDSKIYQADSSKSKVLWMDDLQFYDLYNSISVISERLEVENEKLCAMEPLLQLTRFCLERGLSSEQLDQQATEQLRLLKSKMSRCLDIWTKN